MAMTTAGDEVRTTMQRIRDAWTQGRPDDLGPLVHPDIVMVIPGWAGESVGRSAFVAGFRDFCSNARLHSYDEHDLRADVAGRTAVASLRFDMVYELAGVRYRSTGRDLWVFERQDAGWIAVWRTMLDVAEEAAP